MNKSIALQVGVKIFLENENGQYLFLKRSSLQYPRILNLWDIPGGRIIPGTSLHENLQREVSEETKLKIIDTPIFITAQDIIRKNEKHIVRITFKGHTHGTPILDKEHTEYQWCTLREILTKKGLDEFTKEIIQRQYIV